jgi:hypothetical protein
MNYYYTRGPDIYTHIKYKPSVDYHINRNSNHDYNYINIPTTKRKRNYDDRDLEWYLKNLQKEQWKQEQRKKEQGERRKREQRKRRREKGQRGQKQKELETYAKPFLKHFENLGITDFNIIMEMNQTKIKKLYFSQVKKWHPDRNPGNLEKSTEMTKKINSSYKWLKDNFEKTLSKIIKLVEQIEKNNL